jgi:hypothetical protein
MLTVDVRVLQQRKEKKNGGGAGYKFEIYKHNRKIIKKN